MFSYVITNVKEEKFVHALGNKEGINYYDVKEKIEDELHNKFPLKEGWELKSLIIDDEPIQFLEKSEMLV